MKSKVNIFLMLLVMVCVTACSSDEVPEVGKTDTTEYVTFSATYPMTFKMIMVGSVPAKFEYSLDGSEWSPYIYDHTLHFGGSEGELRLRGKNPCGTAVDVDNYVQIEFNGQSGMVLDASGDIRTLVDWENYRTADTSQARFLRLFLYNYRLTSAPKLPSMDLADNCYFEMFARCHALEEAPELPAVVLSERCYMGMFFDCQLLKETPVLPATETAPYCYAYMFQNCVGLKEPSSILAASMDEYVCYYMFSNCSNLQVTPELPATNISEGSYFAMFRNCPNLSVAPTILPATTLATKCYERMFEMCYSLKKTPILPAEDLVEDCYRDMFYNCNSLNEATMLASNILIWQDFYIHGWLHGVASSGVFRKNANTTLDELNNVRAIPNGWSVEDYNS